MGSETLAKLLRPRNTQPEPDIAADGLAGVLAKAAAVTGLDELKTALEATSNKAQAIEPAGFIADVQEAGLNYHITCNVEDQLGMLVIDASLILAIGDVLTGELDGPDHNNPERAPTEIDTALCRPFLDALLFEFSEILRELRGDGQTEVYQTGRLEKEPSPHQFPEVPYLSLSLEIDISNGARRGGLHLLLPAKNTSFTSSLQLPGETSATWKQAFSKSVEAAPASFDVILHRKQLPIGEVLRLKPGDILTIPTRALENLSIESKKGKQRHAMMRARLGEYQEMRAAKITGIGEMKKSTKEAMLIGANSNG